MKAVWNGQVVAETDDTVVVEGNHYFPRAVVADELLTPSVTTTYCPWKGTAHYFHVTVAGKTSQDGMWYYPEPKPAAKEITERVAFWHGVEVTA